MNALSVHLRAEVHREGKKWEQEYTQGKATYPTREIGTTDRTGTSVTFHPDPEIFTDTLEYSYDTLARRLRELSFLNKGITLTLTGRARHRRRRRTTPPSTFHSETGLKEFVSLHRPEPRAAHRKTSSTSKEK